MTNNNQSQVEDGIALFQIRPCGNVFCRLRLHMQASPALYPRAVIFSMLRLSRYACKKLRAGPVLVLYAYRFM